MSRQTCGRFMTTVLAELEGTHLVENGKKLEPQI